jgi:hypothetical protein
MDARGTLAVGSFVRFAGGFEARLGYAAQIAAIDGDRAELTVLIPGDPPRQETQRRVKLSALVPCDPDTDESARWMLHLLAL